MNKTNELIQRFLGEPVKNIMHSMYDDYVEANVRFRNKAGIKTFIIRRELAKCCKWCHDLAGIYETEKAPNNIYQRHDYCRCMVTFRSEKGLYTDVWTKKEYRTQRAARIAAAENLASEKIVLGFNGKIINYKNVEKEYLSRRKIKKGPIINEYENHSDQHKGEWMFAQWIHSIFGGKITRKLADDSLPNNPDYEWNGRLWELKGPETSKYNTIDKRICDGLEQIEENPGGLMIDFENSDLDYETAKEYVIRIIDSKAHRTTDVIIKKGNRFGVFRIIKE